MRQLLRTVQWLRVAVTYSAALATCGAMLAGGCADHTDNSESTENSSNTQTTKPSKSTGNTTDSARPADEDRGVPNLEIRDGEYVTPTGTEDLAKLPRGTVLATSSGTASKILNTANRFDFLYTTLDHTNTAVAVSGTLLLPSGTPPTQGWPLVSWAHGTTGVADVCTPSMTENLFYNEYAQVARAFLTAGYAVVATDYLGLGTAGIHSYSIGEDLGNAVADSVPAAHQLSDQLSPEWFGVGHSEGGQAVLFATRAAAKNPDFPLRATVAMAPSSNLQLAFPSIASGGLPADLVYGTYLLAGLSRVDPSLRPEDFLGPSALKEKDLLFESGCLLDGLEAFNGLAASDILAIPEEKIASLSELLAKVGNAHLEPTLGPLLVVQGETDHDIPAGVTALLVDQLTALGVDVTYREYPGLDHDRVLGPSLCETLEWLTTHGGPPAPNCVAEPTDMS